MLRFAIHPDSPLIEQRESSDVFSWSQAGVIVGMHLLALPALWRVSALSITLFLVLHCLCLGGGIALGYHKLLSHRSYRAPGWLTYILATLGTLAFQVGPLLWAAVHRAHHAHTDEKGDAHASARGFWWSHVGWTFYRRPNGFEYVSARRLISDLHGDAYLRFLNRHMVGLNVAVALIVAILVRRVDIIVWMFPLRIVIGWHLTWLINSYSHCAPITGGKKHAGIRNNAWLGVLAFGEGWHANHHRHPGRANFALAARQIDPAYIALRLLSRLGIVELRLEDSRRIAAMAPQSPAISRTTTATRLADD